MITFCPNLFTLRQTVYVDGNAIIFSTIDDAIKGIIDNSNHLSEIYLIGPSALMNEYADMIKKETGNNNITVKEV